MAQDVEAEIRALERAVPAELALKKREAYALALRRTLVSECGLSEEEVEEAASHRLTEVSELVAWDPQARVTPIDRYLVQVREVFDAAPTTESFKLGVTVRYREVNYSALVDVDKPRIANVVNASLGRLLRLTLKARRVGGGKTMVPILSGLDGAAKPGEMTLVMAPPGGGKSTYLKALAGRLRPSKKTALSGSVTYNGAELYPWVSKKSSSSAAQKGAAPPPPFVVSKVAAYVGQQDEHSPALTVGETLDFAWRMQHVHDASEEIEAIEVARPSLVMRVLGIEHVKDTIVGDAKTRGISGGQRKRCTVAEMLVGYSRVVAGDEITTGLDSQTALEIIQAMRAAARVFNLTFVLSLLQPPPECYAAFDTLVLLDAGRLVYSGPRTDALSYFEGLGYRLPDRKDEADFMLEVTTPFGQSYHLDDHGAACLSADDWAAAFKARATRLNSQHLSDADAASDTLRLSGATRPDSPTASMASMASMASDAKAWPKVFRVEYPHSLKFYVLHIAKRRILEIKGKPSMTLSKLFTSIFVGLATGRYARV